MVEEENLCGGLGMGLRLKFLLRFLFVIDGRWWRIRLSAKCCRRSIGYVDGSLTFWFNCAFGKLKDGGLGLGFMVKGC